MLLKGAVFKMAEEKTNEHYNESDIQVLEGLEAVRKRPGMYIGTTSKTGLHHLVWEIVDNSIDEALAGYGKEINLTILPDNVIEVVDHGRGVPTGLHPKTGKSTVETIYTILHAGGKFGEGGGYKVSGGLHGVGASVVNALSTFMEVWVKRDGKIHFQKFVNGGHCEAPLKVVGECPLDDTGTTVRFKADGTIFEETTEYDYDILKERMRQLAFLNEGIKMTVSDKRVENGRHDEFLYEIGLEEYIKFINANKTPIHEHIIHVKGQEDAEVHGKNETIMVEGVIQYNDGYIPNLYSFCNNIHTSAGGTHEEGFRLAICRVVNNYAREKKMLKDNEFYLDTYFKNTFINFLINAKKSTYANSNIKKVESSRVGSSDYHYEEIIDNKKYIYHDTYFGGTKFMGEEVVYCDDSKPIWGMNYYGVTLDDTLGEEAMDKALRPALMKVGEDENIIPVRGIAKFENNGYTYTFKTTGTIEKFDGIEQIYKANNLIYELHCSGGMIV